MSAIENAALTYHDNHHWVPLRLEGKSPECMGKGWRKRTLADPLPHFQPGDNLGILLGAPSNNLVRLDPDYQAIDAVTQLIFSEPTAMTGRRSSPRSGRFYTCPGLKTTNFKLPNAMKDDPRLPLHDGKPNLVVFQILSTGAQTVAPPSIHPSGEQVWWIDAAPPMEIEPGELLQRVGMEAFLMAVGHFWPPRGSRNEAALALSRVLLEALSNWDEEARIAFVDDLVVAVAMAGGDGEASRDGKRRAAATLAKMKAGEETTGMPRLVELLELPPETGRLFHKWLGVVATGRALGVAQPLEWRETVGKYHTPVGSLFNAQQAITALGVECSYDMFHDKILIGYHGEEFRHVIGGPRGIVTDNVLTRLRQIISDRYGFDPKPQHVLDAVKGLALDHCLDPVVEMLDAAQRDWDGVERLDTWVIDYLKCDDTPLNRAIGRKALIAAVHRARVPGCKFDNITVLESPEGYLKSSAVAALAGDAENFSDQSILGASDREIQEQLQGIWMHENADLAGMNKADVERVKAFASRRFDRARRAYGRVREDQPRRSVEWGTTNNEEYLPSPTGNRRFWPLRVKAMIDIEALKRDRLALFGEAATYEAKGEA